MEEYVILTTTAENKEDAEKIAKHLVQNRLAACVQILGPISSTYWWKEKMETADEFLCIIKTKKALLQDLEKAIKEIHPYETPEIIASPVIFGSKEYLSWILKETQ